MKDQDEMRESYERSDFTELERGKFYREAVEGLCALAEQTTKLTPKHPSRKRAAKSAK